MSAPKRVARATIARLPRYLSFLEGLDEGTTSVSSQQLAAGAAVKDAIVRRDLSDLGISGTRGVGYDVTTLIGRIHAELGLAEERAVVLVGAGVLGHALADYPGFADAGFRLVGAYDASADRIGMRFAEITVSDVADLEQDIADHGVTMAIVTVPVDAAQEVVDRLVAAGVRSILNFAPTTVSHPDDVDLRHVDLSAELQVLAYFSR
ncbi:MAG: redox-sensing transcriptional repressor Rex [Acidimicrobiia bacterium]